MAEKRRSFQFQVSADPEFAKILDTWRGKQMPPMNRSAAIRELVRRGLMLTEHRENKNAAKRLKRRGARIGDDSSEAIANA